MLPITLILFLLPTSIFLVSAVPIERFYPYGITQGDTELPRIQHEASSTEIFLKVPVKFYGDNYTSTFVNANGLVSFLSPLANFINSQFPLDYPVVGIFYANVDIRGAGNVFYRETQDEALRARVTTEIRQSFSNSQFTASSIFIATWYRVGYFDRGTDKLNTFQLVIASNGSESFVELLYADDGIQWLQGAGQVGTGLPDAKAQAGFAAYDGRKYVLPHSGTDQIRNLIKLSNTNEGGVWLFKVGDVTNVESPSSRQPVSEQVNYPDRESSCAIGYTLCHSQATCVDQPNKYCCNCRPGFYGNGYNCLKNGLPIRASGKVNLDINGVKLIQQDLQSYVVVADGRPYTAITKVPNSIGNVAQLLYPLTTVLNWLFATATNWGINGFQITGGVLNHTAEITYKPNNERVYITQKYLGMDVFDQLKMEVQISGNVPPVINDGITINDYQTQFNFIGPGQLRASSQSLSYKVRSSITGQEETLQISLDQAISFKESCSLNFDRIAGNEQADLRAQFTYYRVKTARNFVTYEAKENILRFASTNKVSLLSERDDPCIEGKVKCVANSSCVVEGDSFKCVCHQGFQTTYSNRYTENRNYDFGCLDVNECVVGSANCDPNAICVNEVGSYRCSCRPGYTGSGYQCSAVESPCGRDFKLCNPPNSYCSNSEDYRTCDCNFGYRKTYIDDKQIAFTCVDINECEGNVCSPYENCLNREGSYMCECKTAPGSGRSCKHLDISCQEINNCSLNGECVYNGTISNYVCRCIQGYYGDGYNCRAYGGRTVVPQICTTTTTTTGCICPLTFVMHDDLCVDSAIRFNGTLTCNNLASMCHPRAQCIFNNTISQYQCVCIAGHEGTGFDCIEMEISCLKNDICDTNAMCKVNEQTGKARCVCNNQYSGDGSHCDYIGVCSVDSDCHQNEECYYSNETDGFECRCRKNFVKIPSGQCRQLRSCSTCHPYGRCIQDHVTMDSFCECLPGFEGDGVHSCNKILPPCNIEFNCSPYARCDYQQSTNKFECRCKQGYVGNGTTCYDVRTCADAPEICDRNAKCIGKGYGLPPSCECVTGFIGNGTSCSEIAKYEGGFLLVNLDITTFRVPYEPSITDPGYPIQVQENQIATGIAIDCTLGRVYWSDYNGHKIKSSTFRGKNVTTLVDKNITSVEGLAVDGINRNIYWTDSGKKVIESSNLEGTERKMIISSNLSNPRGIAVHPYKQKLFWSDWNRAHPTIEWSNLDGSYRSVFLYGLEVQLPNSVTVDLYTNELCWADAGTKRIMCANIDTRQYRLITDSCISPFSLTVSADKYFWTEWVLGKIGYYDKRTRKAGNLTLPLVTGGRLYGIVNVPTECP